MIRFQKDAYTINAVIEAGVHPATAKTLLASGPNATPMKARCSMHGRRRTEPTQDYVWGPDANTLLAEQAAR